MTAVDHEARAEAQRVGGLLDQHVAQCGERAQRTAETLEDFRKESREHRRGVNEKFDKLADGLTRTHDRIDQLHGIVSAGSGSRPSDHRHGDGWKAAIAKLEAYFWRLVALAALGALGYIVTNGLPWVLAWGPF